MSKKPEYYLVKTDVMPEVYLRVVEARRMVESGDALTVGDACRIAQISRSAFYKYKDAIFPFYDLMTGRIVTFHSILEDSPGVLSSILEVFAGFGVNILTINQSIPIDGNATLAITADTSGVNSSVEHIVQTVLQLNGVVKFEILASGK